MPECVCVVVCLYGWPRMILLWMLSSFADIIWVSQEQQNKVRFQRINVIWIRSKLPNKYNRNVTDNIIECSPVSFSKCCCHCYRCALGRLSFHVTTDTQTNWEFPCVLIIIIFVPPPNSFLFIYATCISVLSVR